jgi:hypothetical protein
MPNNFRIHAGWLAVLFMVLGCRPLSLPFASPTPSLAIPLSPSGTMTMTPLPSLTRTPEPSSTPLPSLTPTQTPAVTWTPLPTLPVEEAQALIQDLLENNAGCRLPCWWGIVPGETSWQEAHQFLAPFATKFEQGGSGQIVEGGITYQTTNYTVAYEIVGEPRGGGAGFGVKNGIVDLIYVGPNSTIRSYQLHQLLTNYGKPNDIFVETFSNLPDGYLPFRLALFYSEQRILAEFEYEAQRADDMLKGCPQPIGPQLSLWGANKVLTEEDIQRQISGPDTDPPLSLEEVTDMSIETFYQTFKNPAYEACIETPVELWP